MAKIKKNASNMDRSKKETTKRPSLSVARKTMSPKNRRKTIGTLLPAFGKKAEQKEDWSSKIYHQKSTSLEKSHDVSKKRGNERVVTKPNKLNISEETVRSGIQALFTVSEKTKAAKRGLFEDEQPIFLQVAAMKIPKCPVRTLRLRLKNSLLKDDAEVCLITADLPDNKRNEHERVVEHFENLLRAKGITNIKAILPYHQFRTEYDQFELKRKLVELYDVFLSDAKVSKYVSHKMGKIFMQKRKLPVPVKLHVTKLKEHIETALKKTAMNVHPHGDNYSVQVAHTHMGEDEIFENVLSICEELQREFPGGWDNVMAINIKTPASMSIPIYFTLKRAAEIKTPCITSKRPKKFETVSGELSTELGKDVTVFPSGKVHVKDREGSDYEESDEDGSVDDQPKRKRKKMKKKRNVPQEDAKAY